MRSVTPQRADFAALVLATVAAVAACGGADATSGTTPTSTQEFSLRLTTDSARVSVPCDFGELYCFTTVPSSGTKTSQLVLGPQTTDLSAPEDGLGTIVEVFSGVQFEDSLTGKAVVNTAGTVTVFAGPVPFNGYYDYVILTGTITNGQYSGRWSRQLDPHGLYDLGSFVTVP